MSDPVCLVVGTNAHSRAVAQAAARAAFPSALIRTFNDLDEALACEFTGASQLLILSPPIANAGDISKGISAQDSQGHQRWAIVTAGIPSVESVEAISNDDWKESVLVWVFRSAVNRHVLMRENERLQGDLRTIAHRFVHDLRTPLGGIQSAGEMLEETLAEYTTTGSALTKPLFDSVDDLKKIIDRLSLISKASAHPVSKEPVPMQEVIWMVLQRAERLRLKPGAVRTQLGPWPEVEGVSSWLETIWWDLLVKARQQGDDSAQIELGWAQEPAKYRFWLRDETGHSAPAKFDDCFQPFHLLHQTHAKLDLGLAIVRRLVELQGGQCGHEAHPKGGSGFFFTLPHFVNAQTPEVIPPLAVSRE